mgnify:CR=1 FL=1
MLWEINMSRFSLENFVKEPIEPPLPEWTKGKPLQKKLYLETLDMIKKIEAKFVNPKQASNLKPTQRTIVFAQITENLNIDRSNIRKDRMSELMDFIEKENARLNKAWNNISTKANQGRNLSKPELELKKSELEAVIKDIENRQLHDYFDKAVESKILESQQELAAKHRNLESLYKEAIKLAANRDAQVKTYVRELSDAMETIQHLKSKITELERRNV